MANKSSVTKIMGHNYGGLTAGQANILGDPDTKRRKIKSWLCPLESWQKQENVYADHHEGTGQWFLESEEFKKWLEGTPKVLWCHGDPGSGKTVLASIVVNHLRQKVSDIYGVGVAAIYCEWKRQELMTPRDLLASIWDQLVLDQPLGEEIEHIYDSHAKFRTMPTHDEVYSLVRRQIRTLSSVYIIVDALDELDDDLNHRRAFIEDLESLLKRSETEEMSKVHLLVTSRLSHCPLAKSAVVRFTAKLSDIKAFVGNAISRGICSSEDISLQIRTDAAQQKRLTDGISTKASGLFLLVRLFLKSLRSKTNIRDLLDAVSRLPSSISEQYNETWVRIAQQNPDHKRLAQRILDLLSQVVRPLTVQELRHALAVSPGEPAVDPERLDAEDLLEPCCHGLVSIEQKTRNIGLVHHTAQEYFDDHRSTLFPNSQGEMLRTCLTYLSLSEFQQGPCGFYYFRSIDDKSAAKGKRIAKKRFLQGRLERFPFLHYAANHWGQHAQGEVEQSCQEEILAFLGESMLLKSAAQAMDDDPQYSWPRSEASVNTITRNLPFWIASFFALEHVTDGLLVAADGLDLNKPYGHSEKTPLHRAIELGNTNLARILLAAGAHTRSSLASEAHSDSNRSHLYEAIALGHDMIVELLLWHDKGAISEPKVMYCAAFTENEAAIRSILTHAYDAAECKTRLQEILRQAAWLGKTSAIRLALDLGADVECKDEHGQTPLFAAVKHGRSLAVELLLNANASMDTRDSSGRSLLQIAASSLEVYNERLNCIRHFQGNKDSYTKAGRRSYPFEEPMAPESSFLEELTLWFEKAPRVKDLAEHKPFREWVYEDHWGSQITMEILFDRGVNVAERTPEGESILHLAVCNVFRLRYILENTDQVDVNALDHNGRTPLHYAAAAGFSEAMEALLFFGAEVNITDNYQATTLHFGVNWAACIVLAIECGSQVNAQDRSYRTALHYHALVEEPQAKVEVLLKTAGVRIDTVDLNGKTAQDYILEGYGTYDDDSVVEWIEQMTYSFRYSEMRKAALELGALDNCSYYQSRYSERFSRQIRESQEKSRTWTIVENSDEEDYKP